MKKRFGRIVIRYTAILAAGLLYFAFVSFVGWGIPCPIRTLTGLQCPGCGVSRMAMSLLRLDFVSAFHANPVLLVTSPILLFCVLDADVAYIRKGKNTTSAPCRILLIAELIVLLVFGVIRNFI